MSRMVMAVLGLALLLAGCGTAAGTISSPASTSAVGSPVQRSLAPPSAAPTPAPSPGTTLTDADNGVTASLVTGQELTVELSPGPGAYAWDRARLTGSALRLLSVAGGYPDRGPMRAVFLAVAPGTAVLHAVSDAPCLHARPRCSVAQRIWTIQVIVRSMTS